MNPCVKFYRNIIEWRWFTVPEMVQLFVYLVCKADHEPYEDCGFLIERGMVIYTREEITKNLCMTVQTFRTCIRRLENEQRIKKICKIKFRKSVIEISRFERYVDSVSSTSVQMCEPATTTPQSSQRIEEQAIQISHPKKGSMSINERASVDFDKIIELYHTFCPSLPRVFKMSDKRKNKIVVRLEEMSQGVTTLQKVFEKVEASKFMRGDNPRGWKCDFDWIIANSGNWVKVLEGKYDNRNIPETNGTNCALPQKSDR